MCTFPFNLGDSAPPRFAIRAMSIVVWKYNWIEYRRALRKARWHLQVRQSCGSSISRHRQRLRKWTPPHSINKRRLWGVLKGEIGYLSHLQSHGGPLCFLRNKLESTRMPLFGHWVTVFWIRMDFKGAPYWKWDLYLRCVNEPRAYTCIQEEPTTNGT